MTMEKNNDDSKWRRETDRQAGSNGKRERQTGSIGKRDRQTGSIGKGDVKRRGCGGWVVDEEADVRELERDENRTGFQIIREMNPGE